MSSRRLLAEPSGCLRG